MVLDGMMIKSSEEIIIYETPDGGKTIYSRKSGSSQRTLHSIDPMYKKEQELTEKWARLKEAVFLEDPAIDDLISKIEMLMELKK
jgi:hypothetical protein